MKRVVSAVALLALALAIIGIAHVSANPAVSSSPQFVAEAKLVDQTATIPVTTIYTAPSDGLYRISFYPSITKADPESRSSWSFNVFWTDLGAPFSFAPLSTGNGDRAGSFENATTPIAIQMKAGTSLTYSVTQSGSPDSSVYSLYYTLEKLE
jgi:hypothetical protein